VFSRTDTVTDSETFYHSLLDLLEDPDELGEVTGLLLWWNRYFAYFLQCSNTYRDLVRYFQLHLLLNDVPRPTVLSLKFAKREPLKKMLMEVVLDVIWALGT
jgi:hypothetical protein